MAKYNRTGTHSVHHLTVHIVWITKYRYRVLTGDIQLRCRELIRQTCNTLDVNILKGVVSKDHIHLHLSYPPVLSVSDIVKRLKGRSTRELLVEYPELKKRYWGGHLWGIGYGAWSAGNLTDAMIATVARMNIWNIIEMPPIVMRISFWNSKLSV